MTDYIFLFDLDSTVTRQEILPAIARGAGCLEEMQHMTEATMRGELPFKTSFLRRVEILKDQSVQAINRQIRDIALNPEIAAFIKNNRERCYIVTGNLDVWISGLMDRIGMRDHCLCSRAAVQDDHIAQVISVLDKELTVRQFIQPLVVIGDGDNDSGMAQQAAVAIGYGGVRNIAPSLMRSIDYAFYDDARCAAFLRGLL